MVNIFETYMITVSFFFLFKVEVQLIYNIVLVLAIQQSESGIYTFFSDYFPLYVYPQDVFLCVSRSVMSDSLRPHRLQPTRLLCLWNSPGKSTRVSSHSLLQGSAQPRDRTQVCFLVVVWGFVGLIKMESLRLTIYFPELYSVSCNNRLPWGFRW